MRVHIYIHKYHLWVWITSTGIAFLQGSNVAINGGVFICPAEDGGYVLISLPSSISSEVFEGVEWSTSNTLLSQIDVVKLYGMDVEIGDTFCDVDEEEDVYKVRRLLSGKDGIKSKTLDVILNKYPLD